MKSSSHLLSVLLIVFSCNTNDDDVIPVSPTNLNGIVISNIQIDLSWIDSSTNEVGFKIERKTGSEIYSLIGALGINETLYSDKGLVNNTTYTYRVYSYNSAGNSITYSNEISLTTKGIPTLTTMAIESISINSAASGGSISDDNGYPITARGVVWNTAPSPTVALSSKTVDGIGNGAFNSSLAGLIPNTTYYVRSYATNSFGTGYGNELSFNTIACTYSVAQALLNGVDQIQLQKDIQAIDTYLLNNGINAIKDPTGVRYVLSVQGSGDKPCLEGYANVKYVGKLVSNGTQFDAITNPAIYKLSSLILGWQIGLPKFQVGSKFTLYIPSGYAYGSAGAAGKVPANANLIFEIDLIQ